MALANSEWCSGNMRCGRDGANVLVEPFRILPSSFDSFGRPSIPLPRRTSLVERERLSLSNEGSLTVVRALPPSSSPVVSYPRSAAISSGQNSASAGGAERNSHRVKRGNC